MIVWIERKLAIAAHDRLIAEHGGSAGVRDERLLESVLARPQQLYAHGDPAPDLADLAASLAFGIAKNHPFVDGNKRSAYTCCESFLNLNGAELDASAEDKYVSILGLAEGHLKESEYAAWLRSHIRVTPPPQVQEGRSQHAVQKRKPAAKKTTRQRSRS